MKKRLNKNGSVATNLTNSNTKSKISLYTPKDEKTLAMELKQKEIKAKARTGLVSKKKHIQRKEEEDEFEDEFGIDDDYKLWH